MVDKDVNVGASLKENIIKYPFMKTKDYLKKQIYLINGM
jgi:hypothetical protein